VIAVGILMETSTDMRGRAFLVGDQARYQVSTTVQIVDISATDGSDGNLTDFTMVLTLSPGSEPIRFHQTLLTLNTYDTDGIMEYRGNNASTTNSPVGYNTNMREELDQVNVSGSPIEIGSDLNDDMRIDYFSINQSHAIFDLSNFTDDAGVAFTEALTGNNTLTMNSDIILDGIKYGTLVVNGVTTDANQIDKNVTLTIIPLNEGRGYFSVKYLQRAKSYFPGRFQNGDVVRLYFESQRIIQNNEKVRITFIPKIGTPNFVEFYTPDVISRYEENLYPK